MNPSAEDARNRRAIDITKGIEELTGHGRATVAVAELVDLRGQVAAIHKAQAVIEFELDGTIITANDNFCDVMGYRLDEIKGGHHRMFVESREATGDEYRQLWIDLAAGRCYTGQFKRVGKGGVAVWIHASYNPILDANGRPFKVVTYATDITALKALAAQAAEFSKKPKPRKSPKRRRRTR